tara:strand:- start:239 stop:445 length:207 start_codon:yes stop_codon:yes gene_type:complete
MAYLPGSLAAQSKIGRARARFIQIILNYFELFLAKPGTHGSTGPFKVCRITGHRSHLAIKQGQEEVHA